MLLHCTYGYDYRVQLHETVMDRFQALWEISYIQATGALSIFSTVYGSDRPPGGDANRIYYVRNVQLSGAHCDQSARQPLENACERFAVV